MSIGTGGLSHGFSQVLIGSIVLSGRDNGDGKGNRRCRRRGRSEGREGMRGRSSIEREVSRRELMVRGMMKRGQRCGKMRQSLFVRVSNIRVIS